MIKSKRLENAKKVEKWAKMGPGVAFGIQYIVFNENFNSFITCQTYNIKG